MDLQDHDYAASWSTAPEILAFSADSKSDLKKNLFNLKAVFQSLDLNQFSQVAADSRASFSASRPYRLLIIIEPSDNLHENLLDVIEKAAEDLESNEASCWSTKNMFFGESGCPGKLAFAFPGQGSQYTFMGHDLAHYFPEVRRCLAAADQAFNRSEKLTQFIFPNLTGKDNEKVLVEEKLRSTDIAQPAIGAVSSAMQRVLHRFGITPAAACGHSYGELSALYASGCLEEETFFSLSVARGKYMANAGGSGDKGGMLAVKASMDRIDDLIQSSGVDVVLANRNSPDQGVLSGPTDAILQMKAVCKDNKIRATVLPVAAAFHSKLVREAAEPFKKKIASVQFSQFRIPVYSNTTGAPYPDAEPEAKAILSNHLMNPVRFIEEIQSMYRDGVRIFVEVGPRTVLTGLIKAILKDRDIYAMALDASSGRRSGITDACKTLCTLASIGYPVDLLQWKKF